MQRARWRPGHLQAHQLRRAAASWAARRRPAATVAQLERVASGRQHEGFCTREHAGEHGSGGASGCAGQGALGAPFAAALLVPRRSRFASSCEKQIVRRSKFKRGLRFWKSWDTGLVKEGRRKKTTEQIMKMQARATRPLEGRSPTPLHFPLTGTRDGRPTVCGGGGCGWSLLRWP